MKQRCPTAVPVGLGVLSGFRLTFDYWSKRRKCHVADIVFEPVKASNVWGVLWFVTNSDLLALDGYEGVSMGSYRRITVKPSVFGIPVKAYAYQVRSSEGEGMPSMEYLEHLIEGAHIFTLPAYYQAQLRGVLKKNFTSEVTINIEDQS